MNHDDNPAPQPAARSRFKNMEGESKIKFGREINEDEEGRERRAESG